MAKDREELREAKNNYREKMEAKMGQNSSAKGIWIGMKWMTGCSKPVSGVQGEFATELNLFFNRSDTTPTPVCSGPHPP